MRCRVVVMAVVVMAVVSRFVNMLMLSAPFSMLQIYGRVPVSGNHEILIFLITTAVVALMVMAALVFALLRILDLSGVRRAWMRVLWVFRHEVPNF